MTQLQGKHYEKLRLKTHCRHSLSCTNPNTEQLKTSPRTATKVCKNERSLSIQIRQNITNILKAFIDRIRKLKRGFVLGKGGPITEMPNSEVQILHTN